jgi:signal transduction histidine kinase/ligand-binding sensor domain-containing protein
MIWRSRLIESHCRREIRRLLALSVAAAGLAALGLSPAQAEQAPAFSTETFQTEAGLPQHAVVALLAARSGYLWIGTYGGLVRFDGERFTVFASGGTGGLQDSSVTALCEDGQGRLWIGHESGGLTRLESGVFQAVRPGSERTGPVIGLAMDAAGELWQASERGGLLRVRDGLAIPAVPGVGAAPNGAPLLTTDRSQQVWVTQDGKAAQLRDSTLKPWPEDGQETSILRLCADQGTGLWVLTGDGLRHWQHGAWTNASDSLPWGTLPVSLMRETRPAGLLIGTLSQGLFYREEAGTWQNLNRTNGLPDNWVRALTEDREGNLWIGTSGGLTVLRPRKVTMHHPPDAWQGRQVMPVVHRRNGELWAGTEGAGIYCLKAGQWTHFNAEAGLENPFVWTLLEDHLDRLWAGTWRGGIYRLEGGRFVRAPELASITESVTAFAEGPEGTLWIGTGTGLARLRAGRLDWFGRDTSPVLPDVRAIALAPDGVVWAGTSRHGLGRLQAGALRTFGPADGLPTRSISTLHFESPDTLWIGTQDQGLVRWRAGEFKLIGLTNGLPSATIFHVADDGQGCFWCSTPTGLFRAAKAELNACADGLASTLNVVHYGRHEGLASPTCTGGFQPSGCRTPDGHLWFPTTRGLAELDPAEARPQPLQPPPVCIEEAAIGDEPAPLLTNHPSPPALRLVVPPGRQRVQIRYTALSFGAPERVRFRYQLVGLEPEWVAAANRRTVFYSFLAPGSYVFRVTASQSDGVWQEQAAELAIEVLPAWWQTWVFRAGAGTAAAGALIVGAWLTARLRLRHRLERLAREQALERERARIAQDIHDDLGASLTRISMLSEAAFDDPPDPRETAHSLKQISATARELTRAMDEIVWAVNPRHDTLDSLVNYLVRFAQDFLSAAGMRCRLDVPLQLPDRPLRAELRHNLFLAYKEALHNAVRHARATEVKISLRVGAGGFRLVVADNGIGFQPAPPKASGLPSAPAEAGRIASGNGLENMRHRLEQAGGEFDLDTALGEGTRVTFEIPLTG